jgi:hypothetical protein
MLGYALRVLLYCIIAVLPSGAQTLNCGPNGSATTCSDALAPCCSEAFYCGNTTAYCTGKCHPEYSLNGTCTASTTGTVNDRQCGYASTANGGTKGERLPPCAIAGYCCSPYGYCGVTDEYCIGCQPGFGRCPKQCDATMPYCGTSGLIALILGAGGLLVACCAAIGTICKG